MIDGAYASASDDCTWARELAAQLEQVFEGVVATGAALWRHEPRYRRVQSIFVTGCALLLDDSTVELVGHEAFTRFVERAGVVSTHSELSPHLSCVARERLHRPLRELGSLDAVEIHAQPTPGLALWLIAVTRAPVLLTARQRMRLVQLGLHVQNALRLRRAPEAVRAFVSATGVISGDFPPPRLRRAESTRSPQGQALWQALVTGSYSVVPRVEAGIPCYGLLKNEPSVRTHKALTADEKRVVQHASRGLSNKMLGYALGMSPSTISRLLEGAALKLGFGSRAKLVRLASLLSGNEFTGQIPNLTCAEADVLSLVRSGLSNREIGAARNRSERTIANQVASLLRKTGSQNRRRLIAGSFTPPSSPR